MKRPRATPAEALRMRAEGYVTVREVAEALGVNTTYVYRMVESGKFAGRRVQALGSNYVHWYVDPRDLLARLDATSPKVTMDRVQALVARTTARAERR